MTAKRKAGTAVRVRARLPLARRFTLFLDELAATSNIAASCRKADLQTSQVYERRRKDAEFFRRWQVALCEGYDLLEMSLLYRLRMGEVKPAGSAKRGVRSFDNATSFRLLAAHRESAARERAIRDNEDTEAVLASIDATLDAMRLRAQEVEDVSASVSQFAERQGATLAGSDDAGE
ncbi:hypothetical protein ACFO0A_00835 [Novosphingobium tardum]|uniref:Uncharacterized protein n=1 Tax=Novosphingobium tardum TaxID=1538021 RepID=A0ABV8RMU4_9SPHN